MATTPDGHRLIARYRSYLPWVVAAAFTVSGVVHLARPSIFTSIVPRFLPLPTELVYGSGVGELVCAVGLWRRARWAGIAAAVLLLIIWPANLQDAITAQQGHDLTSKVLEWVRFPLQIPLIWFALQSGRDQSGRDQSEVICANPVRDLES
jgi:uncharacterized membrane protein